MIVYNIASKLRLRNLYDMATVSVLEKQRFFTCMEIQWCFKMSNFPDQRIKCKTNKQTNKKNPTLEPKTF